MLYYISYLIKLNIKSLCFRYANEVTGDVHERPLVVKELPVTVGK